MRKRTRRPKPEAVLLLGPTGAGKSPLGDRLDRAWLWGRRCHHFDFGAHLRAIADGPAAAGFSVDEVRFLRRVLEEGALLDDEHFPLAARILDSFMARRRVGPADLIVLNGLPRHLEQARAVDRIIKIIGVVELRCDARTAMDRLRRNAGGDRSRRPDDTEALVARKLALYEKRTQPLLARYSRKGVPRLKILVRAQSNVDEMSQQLQTWSH